MAAVGAAVLLITRTTEPRLVYDEVDERARPDVHIGFREYFRQGLPLTLRPIPLRRLPRFKRHNPTFCLSIYACRR
jgi:hypothetical protein